MVRGIILRGADIGDVSREIWPLVAFFAAAMLAAMLRFRKRLD
jgi:ABC-2 type transport system permease protein